MKKRNKNLTTLGYPIIMLLSLVLWSCNSQAPTAKDNKVEDEAEYVMNDAGMLPTATQLITKKWKVSEFEVPELENRILEPGQAAVFTNAREYLYDLQVDDILVVFDKNGEYIADGRWELAQDTTNLTITLNEETRDLRIEHFQHDRLGLVWQEQIENERITIRVTLTPFRVEE